MEEVQTLFGSRDNKLVQQLRFCMRGHAGRSVWCQEETSARPSAQTGSPHILKFDWLLMGGRHETSRRKFLHLAAGAASLPACSRVAWAQSYPSRPLTLIVFVPAGGLPDISARFVGQSLSERLGQSIVVDNRPGAGGSLAIVCTA